MQALKYAVREPSYRLKFLGPISSLLRHCSHRSLSGCVSFGWCSNCEMINVDSSVPIPPARSGSYADYLETKFGSSHYWLIKFLREGVDKPVDCNSEQSCMDIHIVDSINGTLKDQSFKILPGDRDAPTFLAVLEARPASVQTRLILVQAKQLGHINGAYIDAIASHFMLSPFFLSAYVQLCLRSSQKTHLAGSQLPVLLPSERAFLQLVQDDHSHMTAAITKSGGGNTSRFTRCKALFF